MESTSPWRSPSAAGAIGSDAAHVWALLEAAHEATADDVVHLVEALGEALPDAALWEPAFDALTRAPGLVERWRDTRGPLRSCLAHGLLRAGLVRAEEVPSDLCERIAGSYVDGEERAFLARELAAEALRWPASVFEAAVRNAALASEGSLPCSVVRFAAASASPRDAVQLALRADDDFSLDVEPVGSWGLLEQVSPVELTALGQLTEEWLGGSVPMPPPMSRFRAFRVLLERALADEAHDALLPVEMFDWQGDLASSSTCGLCGGAHLEQTLPFEPSLAVVHVLSRLPLARALRIVERATSASRREVTTLVRRWLTELRNVSAHAGAELTTLPDPLREAVSFARARLAVADDGSLPRTLQRDVLVCLGAGASSSSLDADPEPDLHVLERAIENSRARVERLLELNAPLVVVLRDASRLRVLECLPPVPAELLTETSTHAPRGTLSDNVGVRREVTLSLLVLRDLAGPDPAFEPMLAQLERIRCGAPDDGPNTAAALDAAWAPRTDFAAAVVHYAFCAIDIARGDDERTDQDALYDIAERAVRRRQDASAARALHAELDAEHRRAWWTKWLLEFVPLAVRTADAPE